MARYRLATTILTAILGLILCDRAMARGREEFGNKPLSEHNYTGWPGIVPLVNDHARVYTQWVNGNEHFYYQGNTEALNDTLRKLAEAKTEVREVVVRPGPGTVQSFDRSRTVRFGWSLHCSSICGTRCSLLGSVRARRHLRTYAEYDGRPPRSSGGGIDGLSDSGFD